MQYVFYVIEINTTRINMGSKIMLSIILWFQNFFTSVILYWSNLIWLFYTEIRSDPQFE
jgi:hypothetical protein